MAKGNLKEQLKTDETPAWRKAIFLLDKTPLVLLATGRGVRCDNGYPIGRDDWAYVCSDGSIYLNPRKKGTEKEWAYIIAHCYLHLGLGHIREEKRNDPYWNAACDMVVASYLKDGGIGKPPPEFQATFPFAPKDEDQTAGYLRAQHLSIHYGTMSGDRPDMVWNGEPQPYFDYVERFSQSIQYAMQLALRSAAGENVDSSAGTYQRKMRYHVAREWFISSYPLLGALASSFNIVDDADVVRRMDIPVAAISAQMGEIYINPHCNLSLEEWRFVLAHEFLHAALRHDLRCEDRHPELWNVACDYVVNGWLVAMNIGTMPEFALYDSTFGAMSVETVYDTILSDIRFYCGKNRGDILYGDAAFWESTKGSELDELYRSAIARGLEYHEQHYRRGLLPAGLVEEVHALFRTPIRWDVELAKWFDGHFAPLEKHRTYACLSRRQSTTPTIPRPAWRMEEEAQEQRIFGVLLDTSGSMDRHLLAAALGSIASYAEARDVKHVRVVFCDAAPYDQGVMNPDEIAGRVKVHGRGGTKLQPGIDLLDADKSFPKDAPLLIITDGMIDRLSLRGREHAYLMPYGYRVPFPPRGPVFKLK